MKCAFCKEEVVGKVLIGDIIKYVVPKTLDNLLEIRAYCPNEPEVHYCKYCGYGNSDITLITDEERKIVESEEYGDYIFAFPYIEELRGYMGRAYLNIKKGNYLDAFFDFLKASWIFDEHEVKINNARNYAISLFFKRLKKSDDSKLHLSVVDMLRREKEFLKAKELINDINNNSKLVLDEYDKTIINYQIELINNSDSLKHYKP